ncbi:ubiquitin-specific protease ubp15, partial [Linderina macrospora]
MRTPDSPPGFLTELPPTGMCLLHAKFYDPATARVTGVGHLYVQNNERVGDITPRLCALAGLPADTPLRMFEEIKPTLIDPMNTGVTFSSAEIQTGDIICFQVDDPSADACALPDIAHFFEDVQHRVRVRFVPKPAPQDADDFTAADTNGSSSEDGADAATVVLTLSTKTPYSTVAERVAADLGARDPNKLRFHKVSPVSQVRVPVEPTPTSTLSDMLPPSYYSQPNAVVEGLREFVVMYERLEVTLEKLGSMRSVRVTYIGRRMKEEHVLEVLVPKGSLSQALVEATYDKVEAALRAADKVNPPKPFQLTFFEVAAHRIVRQLDGSESIDQFATRPITSEIIAMHADAAAADPAAADPAARATMDTDDAAPAAPATVEVFHFTRDLARTHSVPFLFTLIPGESWTDTWARLSAKLSLGEKELKNMGVLYGPPGCQDLAACRWLQGVRGPADAAMSPASTGQHTPDSTPPPQPQPLPQQPEEVDDSLCLYDVAT